MKSDSVVYFVNDAERLNELYRQSLMQLFKQAGYSVVSIGIFSSRLLWPVRVGRLLFGRRRYIVASNLRTNIAMLVAFWLPGLIILNGLGRYRSNKMLRLAIIHLIKLNKRKVVAIQSFSDFRYFRRFARECHNISWVPGSGGTSKSIGSATSVVCVQRDNKLPLVAGDLRDLLNFLDSNISFELVGCEDSSNIQSLFGDACIHSRGIVSTSNILKFGQIFAQPSGYGEGFPHSLADAIVSGMDILIARKEYQRSGLYRMVSGKHVFEKRWVSFPSNSHLQRQLSRTTIDKIYLQLFIRVMG